MEFVFAGSPRDGRFSNLADYKNYGASLRILVKLSCELSNVAVKYARFTPPARHDKTRQSCLCRVWRGGVNWTIAINVFRLEIFCRRQS